MIRCFYTRIGQNACRAVILDMPPRGALTLQTRGSARFGKITKTEDFLTEGNEANEGLFFGPWRRCRNNTTFVTFVAFCKISSVLCLFPLGDRDPFFSQRAVNRDR
jgi:hypothetical protein